MHDNASDLYNGLLADYKKQYSDFSDKKRKGSILNTTLPIYFLLIVNIIIILIKNQKLVKTIKTIYYRWKAMKKNFTVYHLQHYQKVLKKEKN